MALVEFLEENAVIGQAMVEDGQITNAQDFGTILHDTRVHVPRDPSRELTPADGDAYLAALLFTFDGRVRARVTPPPSATQVRSFTSRHGDHDQSSHGNREGAGEEKSGSMSHYTSLDIKGRRDEFKKLSDEEKDRLARAETSIPRAIEQRLKGLGPVPTEGNAGERAEARADQYVEAGLVVGRAADLMREQGEQIAGLMGSLNVDPEVSAKLTMNIMDSLAAQEVETMGRVLGDHGVRHAEGNARIALGVLEAVPGADTAEDKAFAIIVSAYHDLGYLTPPAQVFLDSEHAHWGEQHFDESLRPDIEAAFGKEFADRVGKAIDTHSDTNLDWQNDPQGSALRLADNLALFHAEKLPAICEYVPDNVGVLVDLGRGEITVEEAQAAMRANIDASDHPDPVKERLYAAADEVNPTLPGRTVGMLGAKVGDITWQDDHVNVELVRTPANEALTNVLDMGQSQFDKFAETYEADPEQLRSGEPVVFEEDGKTVLTAQVVSSRGGGQRFPIFEIPFGQLVRHGDHDQSSHGNREGGEEEVKDKLLSAPSGLSTYDEKANVAMEARAVKEGFGSVDQIAANMETYMARATRDEIAAGTTWYEHANERATALAEYADKDVSVMAGMMARLSPARDWNDNSFAVNVITRVLHEDEPFEVSADRSKKLYEQNALPPGTYRPSELTPAQLAFTHPDLLLPSLQASPESGPQLQDAISLFRGDKTPDEVLTGPKVRSFYNNIYDPQYPNSVTVDFHVIEAARNGQAWNNTKGEPYQPSGYVSVLTRAPVVKGSLEEGSGLYPYVAEAIFRGAKANNMTPNDYQAVLWSVIVGEKKN